ncbi:MAG TPA: hypothetical protein VFN31_00060 [Candidatus Saccharimonadales bacterium]|nr:hypothetical protein [Candidatus Saccharimonadales bacterium]
MIEGERTLAEVRISANDFATPGYDTLVNPPSPDMLTVSAEANQFYQNYLKMHKVLVGKHGAARLETVHDNLAGESLPEYLAAAGSAVVEAAIVQSDRPTAYRLDLLEKGMDCWRRAISNQVSINASPEPDLASYEPPHRVALDIAFLPLIKDMVFGEIRPETSDQVFRDCLNIAQHNAVMEHIMRVNGDSIGLATHIGLGFECNTLLAFNIRRSPTWFAMPSTVRADNGVYYRKQTHDLSIVHQKWGEIIDLMPIEVKARASSKDRSRYAALLVRGKLHLAVPGWHQPEQILDLFTKSEEGSITNDEQRLLSGIVDNLTGMVRSYYSSERTSISPSVNTVTRFRDGSQVSARKIGMYGVVAATA